MGVYNLLTGIALPYNHQLSFPQIRHIHSPSSHRRCVASILVTSLSNHPQRENFIADSHAIGNWGLLKLHVSGI
jgi:hypothetical protein